MVRPRVVTLAPALLLAVVAATVPLAGQTRQDRAGAQRPFEALLPRVAALAPGTYVVSKTAFVPATEAARIPVLLQADVLRGPERAARVGIAVGADAKQTVAARLRVLTVATAGEKARVVADAGGPGAPGPMRLVREFSLQPGDYDLEAVIGHPGPGTDSTVAVARSRLSVPDIRSGALSVTPIVRGEASTTAGEASLPFVFGRTTLSPAVSPRVSQDGALSVAFRVYNWTAQAEEKPDLTVEYLFYEQGAKGLHFFNKTKPEPLNADTLGPGFDPSAGMVAPGMMIPLGAFTFGEFQLIVKVTDNRNQQSAEQPIRFTVAP